MRDRFACVVERSRGAGTPVAVGFVCETVVADGKALEALIVGEVDRAAGERVDVLMVELAVTAAGRCAVGVDVAAPVELVASLREQIASALGGAVRWEGRMRCLEIVHEARGRFITSSIGPA